MERLTEIIPVKESAEKLKKRKEEGWELVKEETFSVLTEEYVFVLDNGKMRQKEEYRYFVKRIFVRNKRE